MLKQLWSYYKDNLRLFLWVILICLGTIIFQISIPIGTRIIINDYIPNKDLNGIVSMSLILIIMTLLFALTGFLKIYFGHLLGANIEKSMRIKMFAHFQTLDFTFFDKYKTGQILSRITTDLNYVSEFAHHGIEELFTTTVIVFFGLIYLSYINLQLTIVFYIFIIIHFGILYKNRKSMTKSMRKVRDELGEVNAKTESALSAIRLTRAFSNEQKENIEYVKINESYRTFWKKAFKDLAKFMSINSFLLQTQTVLLIGIGSILIFKGKITFGDLMAFYMFFQILIASISKVMNMLELFQQGATSIDRYNEIMALKPSIIEKKNIKKLNHIKGDIEFSNVNFEYDFKKPIINNLSFKANSGEMVALVGESGIGKSTIIQLIPRFYEIISGEITIDGVDIREMGLEDLRKNIGYVQQDVVLFYGSIRENIMYGKPNATKQELEEAVDKARLRDFINNLDEGLDTLVGEKGIILSGGQKQRISLARIFLKNPPILLLDEATSALDTLTEKYIQKEIEELCIGRTVIVVAHRLSTVQKADKILVLGKGGILESGTHKELLENNKYYTKLRG